MLSNIGSAYLEKGENEDALTYLQQALQIREKLKLPADIAETLHNWEPSTRTSDRRPGMTSSCGDGLYRNGGNNQGVAVMSKTAWLVFGYRPGWALSERVAGCGQGPSRCKMTAAPQWRNPE